MAIRILCSYLEPFVIFFNVAIAEETARKTFRDTRFAGQLLD
jgi:hypothetical protein